MALYYCVYNSFRLYSSVADNATKYNSDALFHCLGIY